MEEETYKVFNTKLGQLLVYKRLGDDEESEYEIVCETTLWKEGFNVTPRVRYLFDDKPRMDAAYDTVDELYAEKILGDLVGALGDSNLDNDE